MKKTVCFIFALMMVAFSLPISCLATENNSIFAFKDVIFFGYTKEDVKLYENAPLISENEDTLTYGPVEIMGKYNANITYTFNAKDHLSTASYKLIIDPDTKIDIDGIYDSIDEALTAKYGEPNSPKQVIGDYADSYMTTWLDMSTFNSIMNTTTEDEEGRLFLIMYMSFTYMLEDGAQPTPNTSGM